MMIGDQVSSAVLLREITGESQRLFLFHKHLQSPVSSSAATTIHHHEEKKAKINSHGEKNSFSM